MFAFHVSMRFGDGFHTHINLRGKKVLSCSGLNIPALMRRVNKEILGFCDRAS